MKKLLLVLLVVGAAALAYNWTTSGEQARLEGRITEVRTLSVEDNASVLLVNFEGRGGKRVRAGCLVLGQVVRAQRRGRRIDVVRDAPSRSVSPTS